MLRVGLRSSGVSLGLKMMLLVRHDRLLRESFEGEKERVSKGFLIRTKEEKQKWSEKRREQRLPISLRVRFYRVVNGGVFRVFQKKKI